MEPLRCDLCDQLIEDGTSPALISNCNTWTSDGQVRIDDEDIEYVVCCMDTGDVMRAVRAAHAASTTDVGA